MLLSFFQISLSFLRWVHLLKSSCNINMHILLTVLHMFLFVVLERISSNIKDISPADHCTHSLDLCMWSGSDIVKKIWYWSYLRMSFGQGTGGGGGGGLVAYSCNNLGLWETESIILSVLMSRCYLFSVFDSTGSWNDSWNDPWKSKY